MSLEKKKRELNKLVNVFSNNLHHYKQTKSNFNEQMNRQQYIDVFLKLLGWDISNPNGLSFQNREIVVEEYSLANTKERPDYTIRMNGVSKFYVEAKRVDIDISLDEQSALQIRRYGWNAGHNIALLTNFEYLAIYLTNEMPLEKDGVQKCRYKLYHFTQYEEKFEEIYGFLSRDSILDGRFNKFIESIKPENATKTSLDKIFLNQLNSWRVLIANDLLGNGYDLGLYGNINESIQTFLNQLVFLRFAEDNHFEDGYSLKKEILSHKNYKEYFRSLDIKYNSELFKNSSIITDLSDHVLGGIVENLYFPNVSYDFSIIDISILSKIYENFLQEEIVIVGNEAVLKRTKSSKIKSVISTPNEIVISMVKQAIEDKILGKSVEEILNLRIADISVGSGIFLIEAYNFLERYLVDLYANNSCKYIDEKVIPFSVKKSLVENVLWGFDINNQAVQLTRFSLLLRLLSKENKERIKDISPILPSLTETIICANSLITDDDLDITTINQDILYKIMPMSHKEEIEMNFDIIIGNPPYLKKEDIISSTPKEEIRIYKEKYQSAYKQYDKYFLFIERVVKLLKKNGQSILLVPNKFFNITSALKLRKFLVKEKCISKIFDFGSKQLFHDATNYVCIIKMEKRDNDTFEYTKIVDIEDVYNDKKGVIFHISDLECSRWFLTDNIEIQKKYNYARECFPCIEEEIVPINGIQTSKNEIYKIPKKSVISINENIITFMKDNREFIIETKIVRDFYLPNKSNDANKSYQNLKSTNYIIFPYEDGKIIREKELKKKYPNTWSYLNFFKKQLLPKTLGGERDVKGGEGNIEWYQYGRSQYLKEVDKEKIIVGVLSKEPNFNIDKNNMVFSSGGTAGYIGLFLKNNSKYNLEYIQAWLSHWFTDEIFKTIGSDFEGGFYSHGTSIYKDIPLLPINFEDEYEQNSFNEITELVRRIHHLNKEIENEPDSIKRELSLRVKTKIIDKINSLIDKLIDIKVNKNEC